MGNLHFRNVIALQETQIWLYIRASAFDEEKETGPSGLIRPRVLATAKARRHFAVFLPSCSHSEDATHDEVPTPGGSLRSIWIVRDARTRIGAPLAST